MSVSPTQNSKKRKKPTPPPRAVYEDRLCFAPNHIRDTHITEDELCIDFVGDDAECDQAIAIMRKPTKPKSKKELRTRTGERRDNADAAAHMQINSCPDQTLLKQCSRCRLVDPQNSAMSFWVLSDTLDSFQSSMITGCEQSGLYCPDEGDIWVWVAESLTSEQRKQPNPPAFKIPNSRTTFAVIHKEDIAETAYISVTADCYTNMHTTDHSPSARRTGFFVMKDLRFS